MVILFDAPHNSASLNQFFINHPDLQTGGQAFQLTVGNLEEYYPNQGNWQKTHTQVDGMSGSAKVSLARQVGGGITKQQFENDMKIIFNSLEKCWQSAY